MAALVVKPCFAVSYGDLYDIEWCPCNPENELSGQGSVVLGQTVMCPCESMYAGYGRTFKKDMQEAKQVIKKVKEKAANYKYYIGIEFNKSTTETNNENLTFDNMKFSNPVVVGADDVFADQDNLGIVIGTRPHPNFGIEAFYNRSFDENETIHVDLNALAGSSYHMVNTYLTKYQAFGVDILGYLPITGFFDFVASVGLGQYYFDNEVKHDVAYISGGLAGDPYYDNMSSDFSEDTLAWRLGLGAQITIGRGLMLRGMYRYIHINTTAIKNMQEFSVGLGFVF